MRWENFAGYRSTLEILAIPVSFSLKGLRGLAIANRKFHPSLVLKASGWRTFCWAIVAFPPVSLFRSTRCLRLSAEWDCLTSRSRVFVEALGTLDPARKLRLSRCRSRNANSLALDLLGNTAQLYMLSNWILSTAGIYIKFKLYSQSMKHQSGDNLGLSCPSSQSLLICTRIASRSDVGFTSIDPRAVALCFIISLS